VSVDGTEGRIRPLGMRERHSTGFLRVGSGMSHNMLGFICDCLIYLVFGGNAYCLQFVVQYAESYSVDLRGNNTKE
jgi:hypothetical protein